jgi:hypothetical protein
MSGNVRPAKNRLNWKLPTILPRRADRIVPMAKRILCDLCDRPVSPHGHYIVKIDVYADPEMPAVTSEEMEEADYQQAMKELMEQMKGMTADELQDQVHRRFEFKLCRACQMRFLVNPLGKPRSSRAASKN